MAFRYRLFILKDAASIGNETGWVFVCLFTCLHLGTQMSVVYEVRVYTYLNDAADVENICGILLE